MSKTGESAGGPRALKWALPIAKRLYAAAIKDPGSVTSKEACAALQTMIGLEEIARLHRTDQTGWPVSTATQLRELARQGRRDLTVVGTVNGNDVDLLAGAGCLRRVETSYVGLEKYGLALNFRRRVESGELEVVDYPEVLSFDRFRASQDHLSFWPCDYLGGTDILTYNKEIRAFDCPLTGRRLHAVPPAAPDVAVIHAVAADEQGNVVIPPRHLMPQSLDVTLARACDTLIVTVEKIVARDEIRRHAAHVQIPSYRTSLVLLGDLGADVVKVERPGSGDEARGLGPRVGGESLYVMVFNRNKRSLTLNLRELRAQELLRDLAATTDVLIENFRPGVLESMGCGWEALRARNPRLVLARISGFGQDGPLADQPCFDVIAQAMSGLMEITGQPDGPPTMAGTYVVDYAAGFYATIGILAALERRHATGQGQIVDLSLLDSATSLLVTVPEHLLLGRSPTRLGNRDRYAAPAQTFRARTARGCTWWAAATRTSSGSPAP